MRRNKPVPHASVVTAGAPRDAKRGSHVHWVKCDHLKQQIVICRIAAGPDSSRSGCVEHVPVAAAS